MIQPRPVGNIRKQGLTTPPFTIDGTLVDDTVALVDSTTALSGGSTVTVNGIRATTITPRYFSKLTKRR